MKQVVILLLFSVFSNCIFSQDNVADFDKLQTPASPGFILLDQTPSAIERPTTPQGLGLSLFNFFDSGNRALEFSPFWLTNHPNVSSEDMFNKAAPVLYNLSLSVGYVKTDTGKFVTGGIRTRIFQKYNDKLKNELKIIKDSIITLLGVLHPLENAVAIEKQAKLYNDIVAKPVFCVDFAAALAANIKSLALDNINTNRAAAWVSFNWRPKGDDFYFTALGRYIYNVQFEDYSRNAHLGDIGARLNYDFNSFFISAEFLQRLNFTLHRYSDYRLAAIGGYQISKNLYLTGTFGKNYSNINNLIALFGINFGISKNKTHAF